MNKLVPSLKICSLLAAALFFGATLSGCQSPMYGGADEMTGSVAGPTYKVGGRPEAEEEADPAEHSAADASVDRDSQYEYRGGRDPITGKAKTQM